MATIRLVPSTYYISNTNYMSASDTDNMMTNTSSDTYGTVTHNRASTNSTYYFYLRGFNFGSVPSDAEVSSFSIKIRAKATGNTTSTSSSYRMSLYNNTTSIGSTTVSSSLSTTVTTFTFPNGSLTWDTLSGYGANFGIRVPLRRASSNTASVASIYGAEIEVTYTVPVYYDVTASGDGTLSPSGTTSVLEHDSYTLTITDITPNVTDNNVDVTDQLVESQGGTVTLIPQSETHTNFTITDLSNAYHDATNITYARLDLAGGTTGTIYFSLGGITIPSSATIESVTCSATLQYNRNGSSSGYTASCQLYNSSSAKGSSTSIVSSGGSDVAKTTFTLTPGSWTASEISGARFYITATNNASSTHRYIYVYGVSFNVTFSIDEYIYTYTIADVTEDHTIVVTAGVSTSTLLFKQSGTWIEAPTAYKKVNGVWVQQTNISNLFKNIRFRHGSTQ